LASDEATLRLCGPCRHFEPALTGRHACHLGLPLLDGVERSSCASFDPFAVGEGSQLQSDCCLHAHDAGHVHGLD
jgi:hypothetical protein